MNNIGVHSFLQDHNFTKSCVRPPAIGEENEVTSVDGRMSTHSSVSGKSEVSTATPRRTDIDLGFEPEGSASPLPMCDRWRSSLHNVLEDSEGIQLFKKFLSDSKQASLLDCWLACKGFRDFGTRNNNSNNSSAASSTTGPLTAQRTQTDLATLQTRGKLARKIFNTYLKKGICPAVSSIIKDATRQYIFKQIKNVLQNMSSCFELDASLFDQAQNEIEHNIEENSYVSFLNSELLRKYAAQCEMKHAKQPSQAISSQSQNENKNTSSSVPQVSLTSEPASMGRYLPRLDEDQVWHPLPIRSKSENVSNTKDQSLNSTMSSGQSSLARATMKRNLAASRERFGNFPDGPDQNHPAYPYFVAPSATKYSVPPASANASDNASSDATSDTLSMPDSSLDLEGATFSSKKGQKRLIRQHVKRNVLMHHPAEENFISVTRRCQYKQNLANLATENPREFFAQLKEKLDKVVEERRRKEREIMEAASLDNEEDILDSHLERVMKTPNPADSPSRNQSPPPVVVVTSRSNSQMRTSNFGNILPTRVPSEERTFRQPQKETSDRGAVPHRVSNVNHNAAVAQKKTDSLRRRGKEVAVGMAPNEVPDVMDVPAPPVDKNFFISEWIKQQDNSKVSQPQNYSAQARRGSVSKPGRSSKYINPSDSVPSQATVTSKANPHHNQPLQPISQDTMMPPLSNPDPGTMLDEVKRRLIEEAEKRHNDAPSFRGFNMALRNSYPHVSSHHSFPVSNTGIAVPASTHSGRDGSQSQLHGHLPGSSSSSAVGMTVTSDGRGDGPHSARLVSDRTTCIYYMPHEEIAYKTQIPYNPVTLGQFKSYLRRKGNFRYFFKQYSKEINSIVKYEIVKDHEVLPLFENAVVADVKECE